jgi:DNA-binding transcriptional regulator LsrR (DeoR family)
MNPIKVLASKYRRDPAVISRAIVSAFREGLVEVREAAQTPQQPHRVDALERGLLNRFTSLSAAIVVAADATLGGAGAAAPDVHPKLGSAIAAVIAGGALFRDGDIIGVGGGRGVYYTCEALATLPLIRARRVTLVSLTGANHARDRKRKNLRLDADHHLSLLGRCFLTEVKMHLVSHPLVYDDPAELAGAMRRTWLNPEGRWRVNLPTHALVGMGTLVSGHCMFDETAAAPPDRDPVLAPIFEDLRSLITVCQPLISERYSPVADIVNRLFYVSPPAGVTIDSATEQEIRAAIDRINTKVLAVSPVDLKRIPAVMLVAGTRSKAIAIRQLLTDNDYHIRFLCTDETAAEEMLR